MPLNRNALMRMRTIDACLRRRQRKWTIEDLQEACEAALYDYEGITAISSRTIRRDLQLMRSDKLGYNAPIIVTENKYYTYEDPNYSITQLPLSPKDIDELSSALDIIRHYGTFKGMAGQEDIITRLQDRVDNQDTHRQIVFIETNEQLKGINFLGELYEHIVKKRALQIDYKPFTAPEPIVYYVSPYILKEFNNRWFVIAHSNLRGYIMTIALDRIIAIREDFKYKYVEDKSFDAKRYLGEMVGVSRILSDRPERVTLRVNAATAPYMTTKPLHSSQQLVRTDDDGSIVITLDVIINQELVRLLLGFGSNIEVMTPDSLRDKIAKHMIEGATLYSKKD